MTLSETLKKQWQVIIAIFGIVVIVLIAGCTGIEKTTPARPSVETTFPAASTTPTIMNSCPIPKLIFNNSQEITKLGRGIRFNYQSSSSDSEPGAVPYMGVVYRDAGFTRIFDSAGKQILFVNDSESIEFIPAGYYVPTSYIIDVGRVGVIVRDIGGNISGVYLHGNEDCIATIIRTPGAFIPPKEIPH